LAVSQTVSENKVFDLWRQNMDIPAIQVAKPSDAVANDSLLVTEACGLYLRPKSIGSGLTFISIAKRNINYVIQLSGDKAFSSYYSAVAGQHCDWCIKKWHSCSNGKARVFVYNATNIHSRHQ